MTTPQHQTLLADVARLREIAQIPEPVRLLALRPILVAALARVAQLPEAERAAAGAMVADAVRPTAPRPGSATTLRYDGGDIGGPTA